MLRILIVSLLLLAGCTTNPMTGRSQFIVVSDRMAVTQSAAAYTQMIGELDKKKKIEADSERANKVRGITDRLIAQAVRFRPDSASWKWEVQVINDPETVNAFCMAGGKMAIYSGMWEKLKATDEEIAQVMGHEIGHALADHTRERMSIAMTTNVATQVAAVAISSREQGLALQGAQLAAVLAIQLPNSREGESEADQIGIELAARAGYDPRSAVTLWEKMGKLQGGKGPPQFLSTHPSPANRAQRLSQLAAKVDPLYQAAKNAGPGDAPKFLAAREAVNERVVARPGELTREEYAARAAKEADTLSFLSEPFERFKRGAATLDCREPCSYRYGASKGDWRKLHARAAWRDLAVSVLQASYLSDLSYFMLGEAARGMGLKEAAATYYQRALEAGRDYGCGGAEGCEGFEVQKLAAAAAAH
jgi:predicted Zn-dependent protease